MHLWGLDGHLVQIKKRPLTRDFGDSHSLQTLLSSSTILVPNFQRMPTLNLGKASKDDRYPLKILYRRIRHTGAHISKVLLLQI